MSSQPEPTNKQSTDEVDPLLAEQKAITAALTSHPDPHVRIIAHMSERQMSLHYLLTGIRQEMRKGFAELNARLDELSGRQDVLDESYKNGAGHDSLPADS